MLEKKTIAFIGSGVMAEAMIKGLLRQGLVTPGQIVASGPRPERGRQRAQHHPRRSAIGAGWSARHEYRGSRGSTRGSALRRTAS